MSLISCHLFHLSGSFTPVRNSVVLRLAVDDDAEEEIDYQDDFEAGSSDSDIEEGLY